MLLVWLFNNTGNYQCPEPEKPLNVPEQAIWSGGCDGGNWIELVGDSANALHFKIYRDYDGTLQMDALFAPDNNEVISLCKDSIIYYNPIYSENDTLPQIYINYQDKYVFLTTIAPAFGGETWEIIKEKYNLE